MKQSSVSLPKNTVLSNILQKGPEMKIPDIPSKKSGKVLTSIENLKAIEEKEMKKEEEFRKKQERGYQGIFGFPFLLIVHCCTSFSASKAAERKGKKKGRDEEKAREKIPRYVTAYMYLNFVFLYSFMFITIILK